MYKKRFLFLVVILLILTGCTKIDNNIDNIINISFDEKNKVNSVSTNYEIYLPTGVMKIEDSEFNQKFKIKNRFVYLYVDTISYHYKNNLNYPHNNEYNHYYKELNYDNKTGYIGINKIDEDYYFCKIVYNYAKVEFYTNKEDLPIILSNSIMIINSVKFNDKLIKISFGEENEAGKEIIYELDTPVGSKSTFNDFLQEYVVEEEKEEVVLPDEE